MWEHSSAGRASALQAEGHRFEPYCSHHFNGPVVQLVRTLACHARGRGFESHPGRHFRYNADLAHLVERDLAKVEVAGSSPVIRSRKQKSTPIGVLFRFLALDHGCEQTAQPQAGGRSLATVYFGTSRNGASLAVLHGKWRRGRQAKPSLAFQSAPHFENIGLPVIREYTAAKLVADAIPPPTFVGPPRPSVTSVDVLAKRGQRPLARGGQRCVAATAIKKPSKGF